MFIPASDRKLQSFSANIFRRQTNERRNHISLNLKNEVRYGDDTCIHSEPVAAGGEDADRSLYVVARRTWQLISMTVRL